MSRSRKTPMMITPTLEEVELAASKIGLPEIEANKFFHYYESNGWRVGRVKMVSFQHALSGWKLRWLERNGHVKAPDTPGEVPHAGKVHWAVRELKQLNEELFPEEPYQQ